MMWMLIIGFIQTRTTDGSFRREQCVRFFFNEIIVQLGVNRQNGSMSVTPTEEQHISQSHICREVSSWYLLTRAVRMQIATV